MEIVVFGEYMSVDAVHRVSIWSVECMIRLSEVTTRDLREYYIPVKSNIHSHVDTSSKTRKSRCVCGVKQFLFV